MTTTETWLEGLELNKTDDIPLTHEQKIILLEEIIKWASQQGFTGIAKKTLKDLENLRQSQRVRERA
jgi:hypothetical protein